MQQAEKGMAELIECVDTMIVIPNEKLLAVAQNAGFFESFRVADDILRQQYRESPTSSLFPESSTATSPT